MSETRKGIYKPVLAVPEASGWVAVDLLPRGVTGEVMNLRARLSAAGADVSSVRICVSSLLSVADFEGLDHGDDPDDLALSYDNVVTMTPSDTAETDLDGVDGWPRDFGFAGLVLAADFTTGGDGAGNLHVRIDTRLDQ